MVRNTAAALFCAAVALAWQTAPAVAADDALVGTWQCDHDGLSEIWTIKNEKSDWSVTGVFRKGGEEVGAWKGGGVKVADGKLTATQMWTKKPDPTWADNTQLTATSDGEKLAMTWDNGTMSGTREFKRVKAAAADGNDLIGVWKAEHDGFTEVVEIRMVKSIWTVGGSFLKNGKPVGAYAGLQPQFADGKLTSTQKYAVKPVGSWSDGNTLTMQINGDKLTLTWDAGNGQSGSHDMTKAAK
jgi:hypothetical protein